MLRIQFAMRFGLLLVVGLLTACDLLPPPTKDGAQQASGSNEFDDYVASAIDWQNYPSNLSLLIYTQFSESLTQAQQLEQDIAGLLYSPTPDKLASARQTWRQAYDAFLASRLFSHLPIMDPPEWQQKEIGLGNTLQLLDSWPIEGGYIDYVEGYPFSGIVNDLALSLTEETVLEQHAFYDSSSASVGFHVLEFLLWGESGQRQASDFVAQENTSAVLDVTEEEQALGLAANDIEASIQNHQRRRQYLQIVTELLLSHIQRLQRRWEPANGYYATVLQQSEPEQVVTAAFMAAQQLISEDLLNQRLNADSSPFSQTSPQDRTALLQGMNLVLLNPPQGLLSQPDAFSSWQALQQHTAETQQLLLDPEQMSAEAHAQKALLIELLSRLIKVAEQLHIRLPAIN